MAGIWFDHARYDGFGNLTAKTGTGGAPSFSATIDAATNRWAGVSHDANGNQLYAPMTAGMPDAFNMTYDAANRMVYSENPTQSRTSEYHYDAGNKRVYEKRFDGGTQEWVYFFGVTGQRLARYTFTVAGSAITFTQDTASVWFGGKLVQKVNSLGSSYAYEDRLGSVGKYLPYGEDKAGASNPANDNEKFATYTRDANTGIDYADQRWHAQGTGRFLTADPYQASAGPGDPGSWNRYGYVQGDPMAFSDPRGLYRVMLDGADVTDYSTPGRDDCAYTRAGCISGGGGLPPFCQAFYFISTATLPHPECQAAIEIRPPSIPAPTPPSCGELMGLLIEGYLRMRSSPLAGTGWSTSLVSISKTYDVDPRALVAMGWLETHLGRDAHPSNNYWGLGPGRRYDNAAAGISAAAATLDRMIDEGLTTVNDLYSGKSGAWCYDSPDTPEGQRCINRGAPVVRQEMTRLGANPDSLRFPAWCKDE